MIAALALLLFGSVQARYDALIDNRVELDAARSVSGVTLRDRWGTFVIRDGVIAPVTASDGTRLGFAFVGDCQLRYEPPPGPEAWSMARWTGADRLDVACREAWIEAADPVALDGFGYDEAPPAALAWTPFLKALRASQEIPFRKDRYLGDLAASMLAGELGVTEQGQKRASAMHVTALLATPLADPRSEDRWPVVAWHRVPGGLLASHEPHAVTAASWEQGKLGGGPVLVSLPAGGDPTAPPPPLPVDVLAVDLSARVDASAWKNLAGLAGTARITLQAVDRAQAGVVLRLARQVELEPGVKSLGFEAEAVHDEAGRALDFLHDGGELFVRLAEPLRPGAPQTLTIRYGGAGLVRVDADSYTLLANYAWFPQGPFGDTYRWSIDLCVPAGLGAAGTGTVVRRWEDGDHRCERWEEPQEVRFPAANVGRWRLGEAQGPRDTKLRAWFLPDSSQQLDDCLAALQTLLPFYEALLGPYPYAELDVAQSYANMGFWQAPAGLIELSVSRGVVLRSSSLRTDSFAEFRPHNSVAVLAHELAHQWWGHQVGWGSYRDQWISESFAEYTSFLAIAHLYGGVDARGSLRMWSFLAQEGADALPPSFGSRAGRGYVGQVYGRGPMALHQLRRQVGDEAFAAWFGALPPLVAGRAIDNGGLWLVTERMLGPEPTARLRRWIEGDGLPELDVRWQPDGAITLAQTQDAAPFALLVEVEVVDGAGARRERIFFEDRQIEVRLPVSGKLRKVVVDPDDELLAVKSVRRAG